MADGVGNIYTRTELEAGSRQRLPGNETPTAARIVR
jgi:hypothetical protein